ncbi:TetR family transcriptional regulator [Longimycelium tulufanense]|uniref:TetR family transcriptional regulator n=1 Tax=Longimycelium tulufanense TaxID=907463 RepID=A0A8J3C928_9PSEU|nr:TetR/AcrR family transcriptional regulator [Longimycelium tulufanense]GGM58034.1 TetR family transcriptional regulator [Longimycelium tulufanense]
METEQRGRPARVKRLPRAVRERQILDAATAVFSQRGYHAASMDEVAEVAAISKPMVYAYLGSKEELFAACIKREATRLTESVGTVVDPNLAPEEQLWRGVLAFFTFVGEHRDSWNVLHRQVTSEGHPFAQQIAEGRKRVIALIGALLSQAAQAQGMPDYFVPETKPIAAALVGAGESLADWWLDHPDETAKAMALRLMNLVWLGFGTLVQGRTWHPPAGPADATPTPA